MLDDQGHTLVVIECKAPEVPLGGTVEQQAREYAIKSKAAYIWISNGDQHKFLVRSPQKKNRWKPTEHLKPLGAGYPPPTVNFEFPNANDSKAVRRYFQKSFPHKGYENLDYNDQSIVLSIHRLLFGVKKRLPFSHAGVHVLEDRGADMHEFGTAGGKWRNLYGDFIAATSGRVEALSVAIARWGGVDDGLRLCVGVRKPVRSHHALQMDMRHSEWDEGLECWHVYHDGRMANIKKETVFEAVEESGAGDWLERKSGYIYLGNLYWADKATWPNSKRFLANVLHYGIIRTNLREANVARK